MTSALQRDEARRPPRGEWPTEPPGSGRLPSFSDLGSGLHEGASVGPAAGGVGGRAGTRRSPPLYLVLTRSRFTTGRAGFLGTGRFGASSAPALRKAHTPVPRKDLDSPAANFMPSKAVLMVQKIGIGPPLWERLAAPAVSVGRSPRPAPPPSPAAAAPFSVSSAARPCRRAAPGGPLPGGMLPRGGGGTAPPRLRPGWCGGSSSCCSPPLGCRWEKKKICGSWCRTLHTARRAPRPASGVKRPEGAA